MHQNQQKLAVQINLSLPLRYSKHKQQVLLDKTQKYFLELAQTDEAGKLPGKHTLLFELLPCKMQERQKLHTHEVWHI